MDFNHFEKKKRPSFCAKKIFSPPGRILNALISSTIKTVEKINNEAVLSLQNNHNCVCFETTAIIEIYLGLYLVTFSVCSGDVGLIKLGNDLTLIACGYSGLLLKQCFSMM